MDEFAGPQPLTGSLIQRALDAVCDCQSMETLSSRLQSITYEMGFRYYALIHHLHPTNWQKLKIALHNCPGEWVKAYRDLKLYKNDPILQACSLTGIGFVWDDLAKIIEMSERRLKVLSLFRDAGVGQGITIPVHIPGEPSGSCTFATIVDQRFPSENVMAAQLIGAFAFQTARRLAGLIRVEGSILRPLTPRQRDCLIWAMRGKTDSEIAQILNLSAETVTQHINMARARYGVSKRMQLAIQAIYLGEISFDEALF